MDGHVGMHEWIYMYSLVKRILVLKICYLFCVLVTSTSPSWGMSFYSPFFPLPCSHQLALLGFPLLQCLTTTMTSYLLTTHVAKRAWLGCGVVLSISGDSSCRLFSPIFYPFMDSSSNRDYFFSFSRHGHLRVLLGSYIF